MPDEDNKKLFNNGYIYDWHFLINQLAKEFNGQLESLGENTKKYITFSVPTKKKLITIKQLCTN